jgi:hypothetical protein
MAETTSYGTVQEVWVVVSGIRQRERGFQTSRAMGSIIIHLLNIIN